MRGFEMDQTENGSRLLPLGDSVPWQRPRGEWAVRLGVALLLAALFLPNLGSFGLWDPWETHYGEVTRNMVESYDWVNPWWGYRTKIGDQAKQGSYFYSKPILIFWTEAAAIRLIGFNEWAIRLPMALFAMLTAFFAYYVLGKTWSRKVGLLGMLVVATCPQFFMLARQAQTDMVFVAPLTMSLLFLVLALFGPDERGVSNGGFFAKLGFSLLVFLLSTVPQFIVIGTDLVDDRSFDNLAGMQRVLALVKTNGVYHSILYGILTVVFLAWMLFPLVIRLVRRQRLDGELKDRMLREGHILVFATMAGLATLGKGLLGFMLPGAILFVFLLLTNQWRLLKAFRVVRTVLAFVLVSFPWYVAMFCRHGNAFYSRFFVHDHFNRLGTGVHQIDSGTFEHFLKWLGVGMYPWVAFVPLLVFAAARLRFKERSRENLFNLFVFTWFFISYLLFTLAKTKFHHYIFPALPPAALLIGKLLADNLKSRALAVRAAALIGLGLFVGVTFNLARDEQLLRNMFTYKYDRTLPQHAPIDASAPSSDSAPVACSTDADCGPHETCREDGTCDNTWAATQFYDYSTDTVKWALNQDAFLYDNVVRFLGVLGIIAFVLFLFARTRVLGVGGLGLAGVLLLLWTLNYYMPMLSPHWSQKSVFEDYYDRCGDKLQHLEREAYEPIVRKLGFDGLYEYFGGTDKRVCPYHITSWLIVWRGETYYSYNELMPLEKKNVQIRPYLEGINPAMQNLPTDCPVTRAMCPRRFYVFMENRKSNTASSVASGVNGEIRTIKKDGASPASQAYADMERFDAVQVSNENDFFTLFEVNPVYSAKAGHCSCAQATMP